MCVCVREKERKRERDRKYSYKILKNNKSKDKDSYFLPHLFFSLMGMKCVLSVLVYSNLTMALHKHLI